MAADGSQHRLQLGVNKMNGSGPFASDQFGPYAFGEKPNRTLLWSAARKVDARNGRGGWRPAQKYPLRCHLRIRTLGERTLLWITWPKLSKTEHSPEIRYIAVYELQYL